MKHKISVTLILLAMFLVTQFIGLFVVNTYTLENQTVYDPATGNATTIQTSPAIPYGLQAPENEPAPNLISLIFSFALAIAIIFILMRYRWKSVIRIWFLLVVTLALGVALTAILEYSNLESASLIAIIVAVPLAILKIFRPSVIIHNLTELLIYPGISVIFIPLLTPLSAIILLVLISIYDMWAVWKSGIMQKMAKFQMEEVKVFGGFLIPTATKKVKDQIKKLKTKYKNKKIPKSVKSKKFKINLAILGGGDVVFPIITAGVFLRTVGIIPAIAVIFGAFIGLTYLMLITKKDKAYPAMPYISTGIFLGLILTKIFIGF